MAKDGYKNRTLASEAAPLEPDSDPDFNAGHYSDPEKKEKKRRRKSRKSTPNKRRKVDFFDSKQDRRSTGRQKLNYNPLSEFFDVDAYEAEDEAGDDDEDIEPVVETRHIQPVKSPSSPVLLPASSNNPRSQPTPPEDNSETEDEDDIPPVPSNPKKTEGSTTEDDDDDAETPQTSMVAHPIEPTTDSATEDSDDELEKVTEGGLKRKPRFPLPPGKQPCGPLVLDASMDIQVPFSINSHLRDYQRDGVRFFWNQYRQGMGGLLGDDMGLGKTIQVISFLSAIMKKAATTADQGRRHDHVSRLQDDEEWREHRRLPPANATWPTALIIAPSSVAPNWQRELATWGYFEVGMYVGKKEKRQAVIEDFKKGRLDVVVTSFKLAYKEITKLENLDFSCIFVDEVHQLKNEKAKTTIAYASFKCQVRFGLTGTAIQNNYNELWTILNWTNPQKLGTASQWEDAIARPLTLGQSKSATPQQRTKSMEVRATLVNKLLPRFFLRRDKSLIKDQLPQKIDKVVFCPLAPKQLELYKRILAFKDVQVMLHKDEPCPCGENKKARNCCYRKGLLFEYLSVLIKLSNHLALLLPAPGDSEEKLDKSRKLVELAFPNPKEVPTYGMAHLEPGLCGKWLCLEKLLFDWKKDGSNKVLIFTKSVKMLDMLEHYLHMKHFRTVRLDGSVPPSSRMGLIDQFNNIPEIFVFLISTLAGGTGLNLTAANKVVIFDPNWNPAHDLQAMDRAFRIGQRRDVEVFRLLGAGSLEELIYNCQVYKQQQMEIGYKASVQTPYFEGVRGRKIEKPGELFGIHNIFRLREDTMFTKMAVEQAKIADFSWALGTMSGSNNTEEEGNGPTKVDDELGDFKGIEGLLLEPAPPPRPEPDDALGMKYVHVNGDLLKPSAAHQLRVKQEVEEEKARKKRARKSRDVDEEEEDRSWPPKRPSKKQKQKKLQLPEIEELIKRRTQALITLGLVSNPSQEEMARFSEEFNAKTPKQQADLVAFLDKASSV